MMEEEQVLIKTTGKLFIGSTGFSEEQKPGTEARWPQIKLAQPQATESCSGQWDGMKEKEINFKGNTEKVKTQMKGKL